ncbi:MAG: energy-coupling factor transporter transmembrane component T [Lachnospiraceae bacterium]
MCLDIRTKTLILLVLGIGTYIAKNIWFEIVSILCISVLQLSFGRKQVSTKLIFAYIFFLAVQFLLLPLLPEMVATILSIPVVQFRKVFPIAMVLMLIIKTTKVNEVISTMNKMKMPKAATITIAVTIRYFPTIAEEWRHIWDSMRLRAVAAHIQNPFKRILVFMECCIVPLIISASKTADELTAAAITRGIENPGTGTCCGYHALRMVDYIMMGVCAVFLVFAILFLYFK